MGINSRALYQCLREDLEAYDPEVQTNFLKDQTIMNAVSGRLLDSFYKKLQDDPEAGFDTRALEKFRSINNRMKSFELRPNTSLDEMLIGSLSAFLSDFFDQAMDSGRFWWTLDECFHYGRPGPGASIGAKGSDFYTKLFSSTLSCTRSSLLRHFVDRVGFDPLWRSAEFRRSLELGYSLVAGNRLSFVPKTRQVARTICTEPNLNMFYQLGLGSMIEAELRTRFNIRLDKQPDINRALARIGSLDGSFCTIDLSSASDTINYRSLFSLIRNKSVKGLIDLLRSPFSELPDGSLEQLHMVSTMGNGFTFPLQTLLFTGAVTVVMQSYGIHPTGKKPDRVVNGCFVSGSPPNYGVFGDDIILPNFMFDRMVKFLELLGFEVNSDKSFSQGAFRESCGHDYFNGHNVRGVYVRTLLRQQDRYSLINRLNRWSAYQGIPLPRTIGMLLRSVRFLPVPPFEQDDAGVQVPLSLTRGLIHYDRNWSYVYKRFVPRKKHLRIANDKIVVPGRGRKRAFNYEGLLISALQGSLRGHMISVRQDRVPYVLEAGRVPIWDHVPLERYPTRGAEERPLWERAVWLNFLDEIV